VLTRISLLCLMLLATQAYGACVGWVICPYVIDPTDGRARSLAILDIDLAQYGVAWKSFDIEGLEDEAGAAAVCIQSVNPEDQAAATAAVLAVGCITRSKAQIRNLARAPFEPYWDEASGKIRFKDGQNGRARKKIRRFIAKNFRDDLVSPD
jgi:hypothetical protein